MPDISFHFPKIERELKGVYVSSILRSIALSLISVFVPIYLMSLGYTLNQALLFLVVFYIGVVIFSLAAVLLSAKIGLKHTMAIGPLFTIAYLLLLRSLGDLSLPIYPIAVLGAFGGMLYWIPINSHFAKHSDRDHRGFETALFHALPKVGSVLAPLLGGLIAASFGFELLFLVAALILAFSAAPLLLSYEYKSHMRYKWSQIFSGRYIHWFNDFVAQGLIVISIATIFPIYIYKISGQLSITGAISSVMGIGVALCALFIGKATDKYGREKVIRAGAFALVLICALLAFVQNQTLVYVSSFFLGLAWAALAIPLFALFGDKLVPGTRTEFMGFRDVAYGLGRAFALVFIIAIPIAKFQAAFGLAALAAAYFAIAQRI